MERISKRPGVVTAAAILLFIYGTLQAIGGFCTTINPLLSDALQNALGGPQVMGQQPDLERMLRQEVPGYVIVQFAAGAIGMALGVAALVIGIGLLKTNPTAHKAGLTLPLINIFMTLLHTAYDVIFVIPTTGRFFELQMQQLPPNDIPFAGIMQGFTCGVLLFGVIVHIGIWLLILMLLRAQSARNAFTDQPEEMSSSAEQSAPSPYVGYEDENESPQTGITEKPM